MTYSSASLFLLDAPVLADTAQQSYNHSTRCSSTALSHIYQHGKSHSIHPWCQWSLLSPCAYRSIFSLKIKVAKQKQGLTALFIYSCLQEGRRRCGNIQEGVRDSRWKPSPGARPHKQLTESTLLQQWPVSAHCTPHYLLWKCPYPSPLSK